MGRVEAWDAEVEINGVTPEEDDTGAAEACDKAEGEGPVVFTTGATAELETASVVSKIAASTVPSDDKDVTTADGTQLVTEGTNIPLECVSATSLLGVGVEAAGGGRLSLVTTVLLKLTRGAQVAMIPEEEFERETSTSCDFKTPEEDFNIPLDGADPCADMTSDEDFLIPRAGGFTTMPRLLEDRRRRKKQMLAFIKVYQNFDFKK